MQNPISVCVCKLISALKDYPYIRLFPEYKNAWPASGSQIHNLNKLWIYCQIYCQIHNLNKSKKKKYYVHLIKYKKGW